MEEVAEVTKKAKRCVGLSVAKSCHVQQDLGVGVAV